MEAQDFEMPSPKRQRTNSPMELTVPQDSQAAAAKASSQNEADPKQEQQQVPDVLDFLMQHVESESQPQEITQSSVQESAAQKPVTTTSDAVTTEQASLAPSVMTDAETVLSTQHTVAEIKVNDNLPAQKSLDQNGPMPAGSIAEIPVSQNTEPAAAVRDSEMTTEQDQSAEAREWETDSSPYSSDSSDTTDSSDEDSDDDDDDDDADPYVLLDPMEQARILMAEDGGGGGDSDDEGTNTRATKVPNGIRTINEKPEAILPKPDVVVTSSTPIEELGTVTFFVENTLLITAKISGEYQVLESGSVLCLGAPSYAVIGAVAETLGRVEEPLYTVRFASETDVRETFGLNAPTAPEKADTEVQGGHQQDPVASAPQADLAVVLKHTPIFYVKSHSTFVFTQPLRSAKGTDASNIHDEEVGEDEQEFSDDEAEAEYKRMQKLRKKGIDPSTVPPPHSRGRGNYGNRGGRGQRGGSSYGHTNYNTQQDAEMNYDDIPEGGETGSVDYTPLRRPDAIPQIQPQQDYPTQNDYQQNRGRGRGGRGNFNPRGRGGARGRGNYQNQSQPPRNVYNDTQNYNNTAYNTNTYNPPASMYPTYQPQMPSGDFSFQAQAQSQWAQYHANQNQQYQQQQQQYGGQSGMPNFNAEALAQVQRQLEEMRRQGQGFQ